MAVFDLGGGGNAFAFDQIGASVTGSIVSLEEQQQTNMDDGKPEFWDNGQPKLMYKLTLATQLRDPQNPGDDGLRSVYLRGSRKPESGSSLAAVIEAVRRATGGSNIATGGTLTITYAADGQPTRRGWNAPKMYTAQYVAPQIDLAAPENQPVAPPRIEPSAAAAAQAMVNSGYPAPEWAVPQPGAQAPTPAPVQSAPVAPAGPAQPTPDQIAALQAAGLDPRQVWPNFAA